MKTLIRLLGLPLKEVASRADLSEAMVKQLSAGNKIAGPEVGPKLAKVFRERADEIEAEAESVAHRLRENASALRLAASALDPTASEDEPPPAARNLRGEEAPDA